MNKTIAIVEDNTDIAYILEYFLSEEGYKVLLYPDATTFLNDYTSHLPDIFLFDIRLPDGDGIDLCNRVKANPVAKGLPVLLMSAHSPAERVNKESSADGFIKKPFDLDNVKTQLSELVS